MKTMAVIAFTLWIIYSLMFEVWKSGVDYPKRPIDLTVVAFATEVSVFSLIFWVIFS